MAPANKNLASWETRVTNFEYFLSLTGLKTTKINCIFLVRIMINSLLPSLWTLFSVSSGIYCTAMSQNSTRKKIEVYSMWGSMADHADLFNRNVTDCVHSGKNSIYFFFTFILAITINSCHASSWITLLFFFNKLLHALCATAWKTCLKREFGFIYISRKLCSYEFHWQWSILCHQFTTYRADQMVEDFLQ